MSVAAANPLEAFQWECQPLAEQLVNRLVDAFVEKNTFAADFKQKLMAEAGVRFVDVIDHLSIPASASARIELLEAGYVHQTDDATVEWYSQPKGIFPPIVLTSKPTTALAIKVDDVVDFLATFSLDHSTQIEGAALSPLRRVLISSEAGTELLAVERHGYRGFLIPTWPAEKAVSVLKHLQAFRLRDRNQADESASFKLANQLVDAAIADLGVGYTCDLFFRTEREYWQRRNRAARAQKARQDKLGIGWSNHDHHTYRSSRQNFVQLIALQEKLGLVARERFYAGKEAGWGAQVMETTLGGITTFNDVDLTPEELFEDFAHEPLAERDSLGTVGLWCALHGEAVLQAGMHHLECMFSFEALRDQLEKEEGVKCMKPFTNFSYLRQAFTEGERWAVSQTRIQKALDAGLISAEQAQKFRDQGALGSHLENLERNEGFKGFNQTGVSEIIAATDPRRQLQATH